MEMEGAESPKKEDSIEINTKGLEKNFGKISNFLKKKNVQIAITIILFALILFSSVSVRLSGLPNLKDATTGHYDMADPDAFYEYRVAQTIVNTGNISGIDTMRDPGLNITYTQEMLPKVLALSYNILHSINGSVTLDYIDVVYPVVAFAIGLIIFFILCWYLTKSKIVGLIASLMLAFSPVYLQRTGIGISSHEVLGMVFYFLSLLTYVISINNYKKNWKVSLGLGVITGISLILSIYSWSGGSNFLIMIFPIFSIMYYLFGIENEEKKIKKNFIIFNLSWVISSIIFMPLIGYPIISSALRFLSNYGVVVPFSIIFMLFDFILETNSQRFKIGNSKYRILYSLAGTAVLGFIGMIIMGKDPITLISGIYNQLLYPFGQTRVALTVAYFAQPYLNDLMSEIGNTVFWIFLIGLIFVGIDFGKKINNKNYKVSFYTIWLLAISGMIFTRISSSSLFNGTNFISSLFYVLSFLILGVYFLLLYLKEKVHIDYSVLFLFAWMIVMLMSVRSAVRVMFVVVTFVFIIIGFFIVKSYEYGKKSKDGLLKFILYALSIAALLICIVSVLGNPITGTQGAYQISSYSSKYTGPITNQQWQYAMDWVRNNTALSSVFVSWWDYGYLIQTLGNRTDIVDGGNANVYWDHLVGRYVLTEPNANASLSFMKSHNVSYLLIDPTDIGKYSAFSSIGSDSSGQDRASFIPTMTLNPSQTQETNDSETVIYQGASPLDQDIVYNQTTGEQIFLPKETTVLAGIVVSIANLGNNGSMTLKQPQAAFINTQNQQQVMVPIRYAYFNNKLIDFGGGLEAGIDILPSVTQASTGGLQFNSMGALLYLSPKVFNSLFAQLYLMNDPFNRYPTISVANIQDDSLVNGLKTQNPAIGDFIVANGGVLGPLEIWNVKYPDYIISRPEFMSATGQYAAFDNLTFTLS